MSEHAIQTNDWYGYLNGELGWHKNSGQWTYTTQTITTTPLPGDLYEVNIPAPRTKSAMDELDEKLKKLQAVLDALGTRYDAPSPEPEPAPEVEADPFPERKIALEK